MEQDFFYCYSNRLYHFLTSMRFNYETVGVHSGTHKKYWVYKKSLNLDSAIELYNSIKYTYN